MVLTPEQNKALEAFSKALRAGVETFTSTLKGELDVPPTPTPNPLPTPEPTPPPSNVSPVGIVDNTLALVWNEEFNGNLSNWRFGSRDKASGLQAAPGYPDNKEIQFYHPAQVTTSVDKQLQLTAKKRLVKVTKVTDMDPKKNTFVLRAGTEADPDIFYWPYYEGVLQYQSGWAMTGPDDNGWTNNWVTLPATKEFLYGVFEFKVKQPKGKGFWTAAWMLRSDRKNADEIDVFEMVDPAARKLAYHYHYGPGRGVDWTQQEGVGVDTGVDLSTDFHTVSVDWTKDYIRWYFDGKLVQTTEGKLDKSLICNAPMYLILNFAVGGNGSWPGAPDAATPSPASFLIDHVRVWQRK